MDDGIHRQQRQGHQQAGNQLRTILPGDVDLSREQRTLDRERNFYHPGPGILSERPEHCPELGHDVRGPFQRPVQQGSPSFDRHDTFADGGDKRNHQPRQKPRLAHEESFFRICRYAIPADTSDQYIGAFDSDFCSQIAGDLKRSLIVPARSVAPKSGLPGGKGGGNYGPLRKTLGGIDLHRILPGKNLPVSEYPVVHLRAAPLSGSRRFFFRECGIGERSPGRKAVDPAFPSCFSHGESHQMAFLASVIEGHHPSDVLLIPGHGGNLDNLSAETAAPLHHRHHFLHRRHPFEEMARTDHCGAIFTAGPSDLLSGLFRSFDLKVGERGSGADCREQFHFGLFPGAAPVTRDPAGGDKRRVRSREQSLYLIFVEGAAVEPYLGHPYCREAVLENSENLFQVVVLYGGADHIAKGVE